MTVTTPDKTEEPGHTVPPKITPRERFIRAMIEGFSTETKAFYVRRDILYFDTAVVGGKELIPLTSNEFVNFLLTFARHKSGVMLRSTDVDLIRDHITAYAKAIALPLSSDPRACWDATGGKADRPVLWINPGWPDGRLILIADGTWSIEQAPRRIFAPLPLSMAMPIPVDTPAEDFPALVKKGIVSFGDLHCFFCTVLATMMMPMDDVHPIIILTGEGAKGKTTTMKLMTQLVDPDQGNECMIVGEDQRNILVTCLYRKTIGLDNASRLPISDDLLSQMYAGGTVPERKLYTNNELSSIKVERMRVLINGVAPDFSKSDFFTKTIFLEQPQVTSRNAAGEERYQSLTAVENDWKKMLPKALGSLLNVIAGGLPYYQEWHAKRESEGRRADAPVRFVEFAVMGEAFARQMGFESDVFTEQIRSLDRNSKEIAVGSDECAQLLTAWLEGERARVGTPFGGFADEQDDIKVFPKAERYYISPTELYTQIRQLAISRGYSIYSISWLRSLKAFSQAVMRSVKNLETVKWYAWQVSGGEHKRDWEFVKDTPQQRIEFVNGQIGKRDA